MIEALSSQFFCSRRIDLNKKKPNFTFHSSKELHHYKLDNKLSFFFLTLPPTILFHEIYNRLPNE
ncbi:hypothetical protein BLOT_004256 [Blomia tropicalis]|nr:hypothetical protein BLOT_004256 [Blomia tropicalis]